MFVQEMKYWYRQSRETGIGCAQQPIAGRGDVGKLLFIHVELFRTNASTHSRRSSGDGARHTAHLVPGAFRGLDQTGGALRIAVDQPRGLHLAA